MEQRFIIATDSPKGFPNGVTVEERNKITRFLEAKQWQVWHWFDDLWLVVAPANSTTPRALTKDLRKLLLKTRFVLIIEVDGRTTYSGFGSEYGWPWMEENWGEAE